MSTPPFAVCVTAFLFLCSAPAIASARVPDAIAVPGETPVATIHAEGAQIYDCKADSGGNAVWQLREPIATLLIDGKTVGRHYAGPSWELVDGSKVVGKVAGRAPGATSKDISWLKVEVTRQSGTGRLTGVTAIQRLNTKGGVAEGPCSPVGAFMSVPYSADYTFLKKGQEGRSVLGQPGDITAVSPSSSDTSGSTYVPLPAIH